MSDEIKAFIILIVFVGLCVWMWFNVQPLPQDAKHQQNTEYSRE